MPTQEGEIVWGLNQVKEPFAITTCQIAHCGSFKQDQRNIILESEKYSLKKLRNITKGEIWCSKSRHCRLKNPPPAK